MNGKMFRCGLASAACLALAFTVFGAVFVVNLSKEALALPPSFGGKKVVRARAVDAGHDFAAAPSDVAPPDSVVLLDVE